MVPSYPCLVGAATLVCLALATPFTAYAENETGQPRLTGEQRTQLLRILPRELEDFEHDAAVAACFEAGRSGDDGALLALAAIDAGRDVVKRESDVLVNAYQSGASRQELYELRKKRITPERSREVMIAYQRLRSGQAYCQSLASPKVPAR